MEGCRNIQMKKYISGYFSTNVRPLFLIAVLCICVSNVRSTPRSSTVSTPTATIGYKYIPLGYQEPEPVQEDFEDEEVDNPPEKSSNYMPPDLLMNVFRTALDVIRNINQKKANGTVKTTGSSNNVKYDRSGKIAANRTDVQLRTRSGQREAEARGMDDYYDDHYHHHHETTTTTEAPKPRYTDPWAGYYDFLINEGSFKFWSAFQLFTAALLLYSCFAAIYYAKYNPITPDYDTQYDDYFFGRSNGRSARSIHSGNTAIPDVVFQFIMNAISKKFQDS